MGGLRVCVNCLLYGSVLIVLVRFSVVLCEMGLLAVLVPGF